jgi:putative adhesin
MEPNDGDERTLPQPPGTPQPPTAPEPPVPPEAAFAADGPVPPVPLVAPEQPPFPEARGLTGPDIEIDLVEGDFRVLGGAPQLLLTVDGEDIAGPLTTRENGTLRFSRLPDDAELRVPDGTRVTVRQVYGDLAVTHLDGVFSAQRVAGDAEILDVAVCELVQVGGDLEAEKGGQLRVRHVNADLRIEDYDEPPLIGHVSGDLQARNLPGIELREAIGGDVVLDRCGDASLVGTVGGDLHAARTTVSLRATAVGGDVMLAATTGVTLAAAGGDLHVDDVAGPIEAHSVGGDVVIRQAAAPIRIGIAGGDLLIEHALAGVHVSRVGGDARLDTPLRPGAEYSVRAGGDIELRVRGEVNARFVAQTNGGEIRTRLPLSVERGRRRNLVGVIGRGDASVTLRSGGDISIAATDRFEEEHIMGDEYVGNETKDQTQTQTDDNDSKTWEGNFGGRRFRVRLDRGPGRAHVHFQGPFGETEDADGFGPASRDFGVEWERGRGARVYGEYEEKLSDLRGKAEQTARKAADQAQEYAERAARRLRETDWESVGREVRQAVEKAVGDLEDAFNQTRRGWEGRSSGGAQQGGQRPSGAQRVKIEYDDDGDAAAAGAAPGASADVEAQRRAILEQLSSGAISLDEAERRLNDLR